MQSTPGRMSNLNEVMNMHMHHTHVCVCVCLHKQVVAPNGSECEAGDAVTIARHVVAAITVHFRQLEALRWKKVAAPSGSATVLECWERTSSGNMQLVPQQCGGMEETRAVWQLEAVVAIGLKLAVVIAAPHCTNLKVGSCWQRRRKDGSATASLCLRLSSLKCLLCRRRS